MKREYDMLADTFGWTDETFADLNRAAARAAFCDEDTRRGLFDILEK